MFIRSKKFILLLLCMLMTISTACTNDDVQSSQKEQTSQEEQTSESMTEASMESAVYVKNLIIYVADVSASLRAIDRYSLSIDGDIDQKTYAFDNDCRFYGADNSEISFNEFAALINKEYSSNDKMTKCRIVSNDKLVVEAYIVE